LSYNFKAKNTEACIEISNLRLCDNDFVHVTFDVCFSRFGFSHTINFSEMLIYRLKIDNYIVDENDMNKQLHFEGDNICLKILPQADCFFESELVYRIRLEKHIIDEFLIEFDAYLDLLAEEGFKKHCNDKA